MEPVTQNVRLIQRAHWLIKLRWIAIACVVISTYFCSNVLAVELQDLAIYSIAVLLALYNLTILLLLNHMTKAEFYFNHSKNREWLPIFLFSQIHWYETSGV